MSGSLLTYFIRNRSKLNFYKNPKLRDLQSELSIAKDILAKPDNKKSEQTRLEKKIEKLEKTIAELERDIARCEFLSANPDELVKEYLLTLPVNRKKIDLCDMFEQHSLTTVPDLSRFTELRHLDLSMNRRLSSGFDRLPKTLKRLNCYKTDIPNEDTAWIARLTNLEHLNLSRNDRIRELPDLSGMTKLVDLDISQLQLVSIPNLPLNQIVSLRAPIKNLLRYYSKKVYIQSMANNENAFECLTKSHSKQIILRINNINRFDQIREELLEKGAKIVMNPARIARLVDQSEIELDSDWSDIFELQVRRAHTTSYYGWKR